MYLACTEDLKSSDVEVWNGVKTEWLSHNTAGDSMFKKQGY